VDGEWESAAYGGGGLDDEPARNGTVEWFACHETEHLRMLVGAAGADVHSLRVRPAHGDQYDHPVHHPPGLVVVGAGGSVEVTALDSRGQRLNKWTM
jgi:hypothetical protein